VAVILLGVVAAFLFDPRATSRIVINHATPPPVVAVSGVGRSRKASAQEDTDGDLEALDEDDAGVPRSVKTRISDAPDHIDRYMEASSSADDELDARGGDDDAGVLSRETGANAHYTPDHLATAVAVVLLGVVVALLVDRRTASRNVDNRAAPPPRKANASEDTVDEPHDVDAAGVPKRETGTTACYAPDHLALGPLEQYHQGDQQDTIALAQVQGPRPAVLLVTTADVEFDAVLHRLKPLNDDHAVPGRLAVSDLLVILGKLAGRRVYVVQTKQSALGTYGVVWRLLAELKGVKLVFPVGIAWGSDPARADKPRERQMIGDVLVADQCINAERVKVQNGRTELRGPITDSPLANTITYSLCREWPTNRRAWRAVSGRPRLPRTHIGTIVSLATLYNDAGAASSWREHAQTKPHKVIGGDIELFQVVRAAEKHGVKWLFAKGISDYGGIKPKTDDGQPLAAANAVDFADWLLRESVMTAFVDNYNTP